MTLKIASRPLLSRFVLRMILALVFAAVLAETPALAAGPSFVVVYVDDQRQTLTLNAMPNVRKLAREGVNFSRAYITTPLCTPSRNSFLSGGFQPKHTQVLDNSEKNGWRNSVGQNVQKLGVAMQRAGYKTAMIGKGAGYAGGYVTPGWDTLRELNTGSYYVNVTVAAGSSGPDQRGYASIFQGADPSAPNYDPMLRYSPNYFRAEALKFLDGVPQDQPFMLFYAPPSMHADATPNPSGIDDNRYLSFTANNIGRGYGETDLSDKPSWVTDPNKNKLVKIPETDEYHRDQLRTLHDTDRTIGLILAKLAEKGRNQDTVIIFASDNGYMWGEHGIYEKANAFEESIAVPLIIHAPGVTPRRERRLVAVNLDVPAMILAQAGANLDNGIHSEGRDLTPLLLNTPTTWRNALFLEGHGGNGDGSYGAWGAIIAGPWKYVVHRSREEELYNRISDPFELQSRANDPTVATIKARLAARVEAQKGLTFRNTMWSQPVGRVGQPYRFNPEVWGGKPPYAYAIISGSLPPGLALDTSTGDISGTPTVVTPTVADPATFEMQVTDSTHSPFNGKPQQWIEKYTITVR